MDRIELVSFYMNKHNDFIYVDANEQIIKAYSSRFSQKRSNEIYAEYKKCNRAQTFGANILSFYNKPTSGIAHGISKISTYLRFAHKYKAIVVIPNYTNKNIINLTVPVFSDKIVVLKPNKKYVFRRFIFSAYFEFMNNPDCMKPDNMYPLIVYNNDIYWFRSFVNFYIDCMPQPKQIFEKIFIGKFEGQGIGVKNNTSFLVPPRSLLGCIPLSLLARFELNGFETIDPYNCNILDVIYYLRHAKEVILSCGTAAYLYLPYLKQTTKLYYMTNVVSEAGILLNKTNETFKEYDYNKQADLIYRFFPIDYKICFYKHAPYYDYGVNDTNKYTGTDMIDFLQITTST